MAKPLTAIAIANLKPRSQRYEVSDPGCAGLRVVVFPPAGRSLRRQVPIRGLQRKLTLGPCLSGGMAGEPANTPELDTPLSLAAARELATKALRQAKSGRDPCAAKQRARQQERAAESDTLRAISDEYLRREGPRLRTLNQRRADLDLLCASVLGRLPVAEIKRGQYTRVLDHIADHNGLARGDRVLTALRTLLSWHASPQRFHLAAGARRAPNQPARTGALAHSDRRGIAHGLAGSRAGQRTVWCLRTVHIADRNTARRKRGSAAQRIVGRWRDLDHSRGEIQDWQGSFDSAEPCGADDRRSHARAGGRRSCFQRDRH